MGCRYEIKTECAYCGKVNEASYAPTCNNYTFTCGGCEKINFIDMEFSAIKIEDVFLQDVIDGFEMTTTVNWKDGDIERICKLYYEELKK